MESLGVDSRCADRYGQCTMDSSRLEKVVVVTLVIVVLVYSPGHAKVGDTTVAHLVDEDVFKLHVTVDNASLFVQVAKTADDLANEWRSFGWC